MIRPFLARTTSAVALLVGIVLSVDAQSTCLPVDNTSKGIRAHLIMYSTATADPYKTVRDSVKIPALATAQVPTQLVQVTTGTVCAQASAAFNQRAMLINASDNNPARNVYLLKVGTLYAVVGDYLGARSDVSIYSGNFATRYGSYVDPN